MKHTTFSQIIRSLGFCLCIVIFHNQQALTNSITIDYVTNSMSTTTLFAGSHHVVTFRVQNSAGHSWQSIDNRFRIYTPDGATFGPVTARLLNELGSSDFDSAYAVMVTSGGPLGPDTVRFVGGSLTSAGMPVGFNELEWTIEFNSRIADDQKTICIDSVYSPPEKTWNWISTQPDEIIPAWAGAHCMTIYESPPLPPVIINVPDSITGSHCTNLTYDFNCSDPDGDLAEFSIVQGPGTINPVSGLWQWNPPTGTDGPHELIVRVQRSVSPFDGLNSTTTVRVKNFIPVPFCNGAIYLTVPVGETVQYDFNAFDADSCDIITWEASYTNGGTGALSIDPNGLLSYSMNVADSTLGVPILIQVYAYDTNTGNGCTVFAVPFCCVGTVGNVDCTGPVDIGDLTALIDHLFITFTSLCCEDEANTDSVGEVDIADLVELIDHLFISFHTLNSCNE